MSDCILKICAFTIRKLYLKFLQSIGKKYPSKLFGRGLISNDGVYEFQTAQVTDPDNLVEFVKRLDENIRLYLKNSFINENYSKNLLFFNKCLNLLKLLNDISNDINQI